MVSIPFKREGTCKPRTYFLIRKRGVTVVSIPFKREGTCKLKHSRRCINCGLLQFQFPSNGKARVNEPAKTSEVNELNTVSIPFKREGTCKQVRTKRKESRYAGQRFNSLQTGRHV